MSDNDNTNVINLFSGSKKLLNDATSDRIKFYAGFNYIKLKRDTNGNRFNKENLLHYAQKCHYMVTVMRELDNETVLYRYQVANSDLFKFMKSFEENTLNGIIIEVDKYFPEDLA
ncbi:MAG: hypothetical protein NC191_00540 [Muribaculaceae bacterium]|nr:hypothetical protein [Muribaculaceae bacterium]